jgi:hypothetical protein
MNRRRLVSLCLMRCMIFAALYPAAAGAQEEGRFAFGVEYSVFGLGKTYAATGALWTKPAGAGFHWGGIEPKPPVDGKYTYDWVGPDRLIGEYQAAGFRHFHIYTQVRNPWAGTQELVGNASRAPKPEFLPGYADYLRALVERYDGDGKDDMPGLRFPIRYWEIEEEWGTFWKDSAAEYVDLLRLARKTVREADPNAKVILQGFLMMGIFDGNPSAEELERRMSDPVWGPKIREGRRNIDELLSHPELFDAVEFHSLGDWTEIAGTAAFLRGEMKRYGYQKPIWAGDVNFSLTPMIWWGKPFYPYVADQKTDIVKWLQALRDKSNPNHDAAVRWFRAEQAGFTAKKIVSCLGEGLAGINMGNLEDWPQFAVVLGITGTSAFCGLVDIERYVPSDLKPGIGWATRMPGQPRPAYWTMKLLIEKLGPYTVTEKLSLGPGVYAYRSSRPLPAAHQPASTVVLWYDDGEGQLPGDSEPQTKVVLPTAAARAQRTPIITAIGQKESQAMPVAVANRRIELTVGETPVLVEEYGPAVR